MQASAAHGRKVKKEAEKEKATSTTSGKSPTDTVVLPSQSDDTPTRRHDKQRATEFAVSSTSAPKRLNDIVQAPPELKKVPKSTKTGVKNSAKGVGDKPRSLRDGVLSMAQKVMLEGERERAIRMYREMKKGSGV